MQGSFVDAKEKFTQRKKDSSTKQAHREEKERREKRQKRNPDK